MNTRSKAIYGGFVETFGPYHREYTGYFLIYLKHIKKHHYLIFKYNTFRQQGNCILVIRKNQE